MGNLRKIGLIALLGASINSCVVEKALEEKTPEEKAVNGERWQRGVNFVPLITEGHYKGMGYNASINSQHLDIWEIDLNHRVKRKLRINYNNDGSLQNYEGNLPYIPEAVEQIRKKDTDKREIIGIIF